ncbi:Uncharacterised protein [uncultured archaeon]|nr:Uncharacterised protein [uncultured archaeon]
MRNALFALSVIVIMLFAGCASQPSAPAKQPAPQQPPAPAPQPEKNATPPPAPPAEEQPPAAAADTCTVEFQKDSSSVYYVMVKTDSSKALSVTCPNGKEAEKAGELYFCTSLDIESPVIAKLDGTECGRADFMQSFGQGAPTSQIRCTVLLAPSRITKGQTTGITVQAYTPNNNDVLTYLCGNTELSEDIAGSVDTGRTCRFDTAGTIEVYAKINGEKCGSSLLEVFDKAQECSVLSSSFEMVDGQYSYKARVSGRGYSGNDLLKYKCYDIPHEIKVSTLPNSTDFVTTIECRGSAPLAANVPVKMNSEPCGELALPAG